MSVGSHFRAVGARLSLSVYLGAVAISDPAVVEGDGLCRKRLFVAKRVGW